MTQQPQLVSPVHGLSNGALHIQAFFPHLSNTLCKPACPVTSHITPMPQGFLLVQQLWTGSDLAKQHISLPPSELQPSLIRSESQPWEGGPPFQVCPLLGTLPQLCYHLEFCHNYPFLLGFCKLFL